MSDAVKYEQIGGVVVLTLNEPDTRNAISPAIIEGITSHVERINGDLSVGCVVVTGAGPSFSSGGNIKNMKANAEVPTDTPFQIRRHYMNGIHRIPLALYGIEAPTIAAVNGPAMGAGCDLSAMCDIRIAAKSAKFAESFLRMGLVSGDGGAWFLPRAVGMSKACELTFTCDAIDADEALRIGLVSQVVEDSDLMNSAMAMANRIAAQPVPSLRMSKRLLRESQQVPLEAALDMAASMQALARHTSDQREAVLAVFDKRPPQFKGE